MSTDRELLEKAAKAAAIGIDGLVDEMVSQPPSEKAGGFVVRNDRGGHSLWNPLTDDGDALRLAHKLHLLVDHSLAGLGIVQVAGPRDLHVREDGTDIATTRRAIVHAAAEIGRAA